MRERRFILLAQLVSLKMKKLRVKKSQWFKTVRVVGKDGEVEAKTKEGTVEFEINKGKYRVEF